MRTTSGEPSERGGISDAALALQELLDVPGRLEELIALSQACRDRVFDQGEQLKSVQSILRSHETRLEFIAARSEYLDSVSRQQEMLTDEHIRAHVIDPIARQLLPIIDLCATQDASAPDATGATALQGVQRQLLGILASLGIEPIEARVGSPFDAKSMRPTRTVETDDESMDQLILSVLQLGFRHGSQLLRPVSVSVFRCVRPPRRNAVSTNGGSDR